MDEILIAILVFLVLSGAAFGTLFMHEKLAPHLLRDDTQATVRLVAGIFVMMTSLTLGIMINSAKTRFDAVNRDVHALAIDLILLDRLLVQLEPEAAPARKSLLGYVQRAATTPWISDDTGTVADRVSERILADVERALRALEPRGADQVAAKGDAQQQFRKVLERRWIMVQQAERSIPRLLLVLLVAWLMLIFAGFGYRAPRNPVVVTTLLVSAALIATSLYFILDMDEPFSGPIQVSQAPLQRTLIEMQR